MTKISTFNAQSVLIKFALKSLLITIVFVSVLSALISLAFLKLDIPVDYCKYTAYAIVAITALSVSYFCVSNTKSNILAVSLTANFPLLIVTVINYFMSNKSAIQLLISIIIILLCAVFSGILRAKKRR